MDVRAADTTSLAAKRLELEKVRPVVQKKQAFNLSDESAAAQAAEAVNGNPNRSKQPKDIEEGFAETMKHSDDGSGSSFDAEDGRQDDGNPDAGHGEHHILDVKV